MKVMYHKYLKLILAKQIFCIFYDHVSIYDRLKFCLKNEIEIVVVDDDLSVSQVHSDPWPPIPTASMIYNYEKNPKI